MIEPRISGTPPLEDDFINKKIKECIYSNIAKIKIDSEDAINQFNILKNGIIQTVEDVFKEYNFKTKQNIFYQMDYVDFILDKNNTVYRFDLVKDFTVIDNRIIFNSALDFTNELKDRFFDITTIGLERNIHFEFLKEYKKEYRNCELEGIIKRLGNTSEENNIQYTIRFGEEV